MARKLLSPLIRNALGLVAVAFLLFSFNLQHPATQNFDEFHYVPSAKQFLTLKENQNWEHPPLGKLLMAAGIGVFGDNPVGWRSMSVLFGLATLLGMYAWAWFLFRNERTALWVGLLTLANQLLYVQARIGMLDTFMFGFLIWALALVTASWDPGLKADRARRYLAWSGALFGLSIACKWFSLVPWVALLGVICWILLMQRWQASFAQADTQDWYHPKLWSGVRWHHWVKYLILYPLFFYALTFLPFLFVENAHLTPMEFLRMQKRMYEGQLRVVNTHPYMSRWYEWPLLIRPIWYAFDKEGTSFVRGVVLLGNPLLMWTGLLAVLVCAWGWIQERSKVAFLIFLTYTILTFSWAAIPRKVSFYYYYYPSGMVLSLALAYAWDRIEKSWKPARRYELRWGFLGLAVMMFVYFYPILAALRIQTDSFRKWMWLSSWI